jgi:hypothetical protein
MTVHGIGRTGGRAPAALRTGRAALATSAVAALALAAPLAAQAPQAPPAPPPAGPAAAAEAPEPVPIYEATAPIAARLTADLGRLRRDKQDEPPWRDGTLAWTDSSGAERTVPVRVRTRGRWRLDNCAMPPLRLNFVKDSVEGTPFRRLDKPKLVSVCRNDDRGEQYVLQELQLYRVYQLLTPYSHRTRLLRLAYVNAGNGRTDAERYAILLEEPDAMAERLGGSMLEQKGARAGDLDPWSNALLGVFQYLIGNVDWSVAGLHNVELVATPTTVHPVAYDFDFSGAVNTYYAVAPPQLPIRRVRERLFRGYCAPPEEYAKAFALLNERREAIVALYHDEIGRLLRPDVVRQTLEYFDEFYRTINDPRRAQRLIVDACLQTG